MFFLKREVEFYLVRVRRRGCKEERGGSRNRGVLRVVGKIKCFLVLSFVYRTDGWIYGRSGCE